MGSGRARGWLGGGDREESFLGWEAEYRCETPEGEEEEEEEEEKERE